jgi:predicted component of type VI protein secretion system
MRLLFERLSGEPPPSIEEAVAASVSDLLTFQYASDSSLPHGIWNFGVPRVLGALASPESKARYLEMVRARIMRFEPRLVDPVVETFGDRLCIRGTLATGEKSFEWIAPWHGSPSQGP